MDPPESDDMTLDTPIDQDQIKEETVQEGTSAQDRQEDDGATINATAPTPKSKWVQLRQVAHAFRYCWPQIAIVYWVAVVFGINDGGFGVILPSIRTYYGVSDGIVSLLLLGSTIGYLTSAFINGSIVHLLGLSNAIAFGATVYTIGTLILMWRLPFVAQCVFMSFLGFGIGLQDANVNIVCTVGPYATETLNLLHAFYGVGALIGPLIASGLLTSDKLWSYFYIVLCGLSFGSILFVLITFYFRPMPPNFKSKRTRQSARDAAAADPEKTDIPDAERAENHLQRLKASFKYPVTSLGAIFLLLYVGVEVTLGTWTFSFLTEVRQGGSVQSAQMVSGYWAGLTVGRVLLGWVTGKLGEKRMVTVWLAATIACLVIVWVVPNITVNGAFVFFVGFFLGPLFPTTISVASQAIPQHLFATAIGFLTALGAGGAALFPWINGMLSQRFGTWVMLPFSLALSGAMTIIWIFIPNPAKRNVEQSEEQAGT